MADPHIVACIDGSYFSSAVCDAAAWASTRLDVPLTFLHAIDRNARPATATDSSATAKRMIERAVASPLLREIECHLVYVGEPGEQRREDLARASTQLEACCASVRTEILAGEVEATLRDYKQHYDIDLLVMGAYGHSRIRHLLVGSTTTDMIRRARLPLLITR